MRCPVCGLITFDYLTQCKRCGAAWSATPAAPSRAVTAALAVEKRSAIELEMLLEEEFDRLDRLLKEAEEKSRRALVAGFLRRATALMVDLWVLALLSLALFYFAYVGFKVGLAAHDRYLTLPDAEFFLGWLFLAWAILVSGYFVMFHAMEGKTVGKWLLGLKVVGEEGRPIGYVRALIRWLGSLLCGVSVVGLLWVLWQREKRGWHDLMARSWVIREQARGSTGG